MGEADAALPAGGAQHRSRKRPPPRWPARCCARPWPRAARLSSAHRPSHAGGGLRRSGACLSESQGAQVQLGDAAARHHLRRPPCAWRWRLPDATVAGCRGTTLWCWRCRPGWRSDLVPGLTVPDDFRAIVNAHFKIARARRRAADAGRDRRHGGMDIRFRRPHLGHGVGRRRHRGPGPRGAGAPHLGGCGTGAGASMRRLPPGRSSRKSAPPSPPRPAQDARRPAAEDPLAQPVPGRRLDRDRPARHHRRARCARAKRRRLWRCGICLYSGRDEPD